MAKVGYENFFLTRLTAGEVAELRCEARVARADAVLATGLAAGVGVIALGGAGAAHPALEGSCTQAG